MLELIWLNQIFIISILMVYTKYLMHAYMDTRSGSMIAILLILFYVLWQKTMHKLFNLANRTHCNLLPYICDNVPPDIQLLFYLLFANKIISHSNICLCVCLYPSRLLILFSIYCIYHLQLYFSTAFF